MTKSHVVKISRKYKYPILAIMVVNLCMFASAATAKNQTEEPRKSSKIGMDYKKYCGYPK